jgi:hypothetical protein
MDDIVFQQLKESRFQYPEITQVIFAPEKMFEIGLFALTNVKYRFDIVWDRLMFDFVWTYFREGIDLAEKQAKESNVKFRLITEVTKEKAINPVQIGCLNKLGRLGEMILISDSKYVLQVRYDKDNKMIASFTNKRHKVQVQEIMFEKYWNEIKSLNEVMTNRS